MGKFFTSPTTQTNLARRVRRGCSHAFVMRQTYEDRCILDCLSIDMTLPQGSRDRYGCVDRYLATLNL